MADKFSRSRSAVSPSKAEEASLDTTPWSPINNSITTDSPQGPDAASVDTRSLIPSVSWSNFVEPDLDVRRTILDHFRCLRILYARLNLDATFDRAVLGFWSACSPVSGLEREDPWTRIASCLILLSEAIGYPLSVSEVAHTTMLDEAILRKYCEHNAESVSEQINARGEEFDAGWIALTAWAHKAVDAVFSDLLEGQSQNICTNGPRSSITDALTRKYQFLRLTVFLLAEIVPDDSLLFQRDPISLLGGCLWYAGYASGYEMDTGFIASMLNVTPISLEEVLLLLCREGIRVLIYDFVPSSCLPDKSLISHPVSFARASYSQHVLVEDLEDALETAAHQLSEAAECAKIVGLFDQVSNGSDLPFDRKFLFGIQHNIRCAHIYVSCISEVLASATVYGHDHRDSNSDKGSHNDNEPPARTDLNHTFNSSSDDNYPTIPNANDPYAYQLLYAVVLDTQDGDDDLILAHIERPPFKLPAYEPRRLSTSHTQALPTLTTTATTATSGNPPIRPSKERKSGPSDPLYRPDDEYDTISPHSSVIRQRPNQNPPMDMTADTTTGVKISPADTPSTTQMKRKARPRGKRSFGRLAYRYDPEPQTRYDLREREGIDHV